MVNLQKCGTCGRSFSKKEHYVRHLRVHTQERPFACRACGQKFARRDTLKRHSIAHHGEDTTPSSDQPEAEMIVDDEESINGNISVANTAHFMPTSTPANNEAMSTAVGATIPFDLTAPAFIPPWESNFDLGPDFNFGDLGTFDISLASGSNPWLPLRPQPDLSAPFADTQIPSPRSNVEQWHTRLSGARRPSNNDVLLQPSAEHLQEELNVRRLTTSLQQRIPDPWLPPTSFLNRTLHTYISRLWHLIPVVHLPSFVPSRAHPLLLLSICSLGALAEGSPESLRHAFNLFEGVQKAILVAWDPNSVFDPASLALIQAATIGQTFAMLSPKATHLTTARAFHNTLCVSVENFQEVLQAGLEQNNYAAVDGQGHAGGQGSLVESWREWIALQTCIRIMNALQCHDGEIAATFQRRPMLRMPLSKAMFAVADSTFQLRTAVEWHEALTQRLPTPCLAGSSCFPSQHSVYSACAFLESVLAEIIEVRLVKSDYMQVELDRLEATLVEKSRAYYEVLHSAHSDKLYLKALIHSCFIQLLCDFDHFERRIGKDGPRGSEDVESAIVRQWTGTDQGKRCVIHAASIASAASQFRLDDVPALHVARTMYSAAVVLIVYSTFASNDTSASNQSFPVPLPEADILGNTALLFSAENSGRTNLFVEQCSTLAFSLASALRCLGPWQNAQRYAGTLDTVLAEHDR